jgi:cobalt-zinc-cadmium efflux system protein
MTVHTPLPRAVSGAKLGLALAVTLLAAGIEMFYSASGHSFFLAADSIHLLAHLLVFLALFLPVWTHDERHEDWAANSVLGLVVLIAVGIGVSSIRALTAGQAEAPEPGIILLSIVGLAANIITAYLFMDPAEDYSSFRAALVHEISDATMTVVSLIGALAIKVYGWAWVDPALSLGVALWLLGWSFRQLARRITLGRSASCVHHHR